MSQSNDQSNNQSSASSQRAKRVMQEHISEISHEIRTPATYIIGLSELMLKGEFGSLSEEQTRFVTLINEQEKHLLGAFDELVEMYLLTSGNLQLNIAEVDLGQLLD